jgi:hypothetical protein
MARKLLADHGMTDPQPGRWYAQQAWLDVFKAIALKIGDRSLTAIGRKIPENAQWPPTVDTLEKALASIDVAYHMNHRGGEIGSYRFEMTGARSGRMVCNNPYPCAFDRGLVTAVGARFKPADVAAVLVRHDDTQPCRAKSADACTYRIQW